MQVEIKLYSTLRRYMPPLKPGEKHRLDLAPGTTVGEILDRLGIPADVTRRAFVNGEAVELDYVLREGDDVQVFPPVVGGSAGDDPRILAIDVGAGTQDILLWEPEVPVENCVQLILPSPTVILARRLRAATAAGKAVFLDGNVMGGGAIVWAAREHLAAGHPLYATPQAALTLHDDLRRVERMGVRLVTAAPADAERLHLGDLDLTAIGDALTRFGVTLPQRVAVAVQDHGFSPAASNRVFRFEHLRRFVEGGGDIGSLLYTDPLPYLTRMRAVRESARGAYLMDTGSAAVWGALCDEAVAARADEGVVVVNVGNAHTLAVLLRGRRVYGLFEHHTESLDGETLATLIEALRAGRLTNADVFDAGGHGAHIGADYRPDDGFKTVAVTGPNRRLAAGRRYYFAVPFGDMMLAGAFGLVAAVLDRTGDRIGAGRAGLRLH